jgi:hypothetical protein
MSVVPDKVSYEELRQVLVCQASNLTLPQKFEMISKLQEAKQAKLDREAPDCYESEEPCFFLAVVARASL